MIDKTVLEKVRELIVSGNTSKAIDILINKSNDKADYIDSLIVLKSRLLSLQKEYNLEAIDNDDYQLKLNQTNASILEIIREIDNNLYGNEELDTIEQGDFLETISEFISRGELDKAFTYLRNFINLNNELKSRFGDEILILSSRYNAVRDRERKGLVDNETSRIEHFKLTDSLIRLVNEISKEPIRQIAQKEKEQKLETSAASFVQESISELSKREKVLKFQATTWYIIGFIALILGIGVALYLVRINEEELKSTIGIIYLILKSLFAIGLLVAASRYAFNLGKTFMNESLKNADRIHAISFGKFYLQVYGANIKPEDLKDVFKDWNTTQESPFLKLDSGEFDPQLLQVFLKFTEAIREVKK